MKHKLINNNTKEETICDKITIDGFDYYVSDERVNPNDIDVWCYCEDGVFEFKGVILNNELLPLKVIATNNPNIDIPKVVDGALMLANQIYQPEMSSISEFAKDLAIPKRKAFVKGYNKSQETHPFSEEDMIEFYRWLNREGWQDYNDIKQGLFVNSFGLQKQDKELLQLWKEQQPKIVYYEN